MGIICSHSECRVFCAEPELINFSLLRGVYEIHAAYRNSPDGDD
jgi:hypothetical protein